MNTVKQVYKTTLLLLLFGFYTHAVAEDDATTTEQKDSVQIYCELAKKQIQINPAKAMELAKRAFVLNSPDIRLADPSLPAYLTGLAYRSLGEFDSAIVYYDRCYSQRVANKSKDILVAEVLSGQGIVYSMQGKFDKSFEAFIKSQKLIEGTGDSLQIAKGLNNIAGIYYNTEQPEKALDYYKRALAIKEKMHMKESVTSTLINLSVIYIELNQFPEAKSGLDRALKAALEEGDKEDLGLIYSKFGYLYLTKKEYKKAIEYNQQSLKIREEQQDEYGVSECFLDMGTAYSGMGDSKHCIEILKKGLEHAKAINSIEQTIEFLDLLSAEYMKMGDYKNAYAYKDEYTKNSTIILNEETANKIAELQEKYEVREKEKNIEKLKAEKVIQQAELYRKKAQLIFIVSIAALVILLISFAYYRYSVRQKTRSIQQENALNKQRVESLEEKRSMQEKQQKELLNVVISAQEEERRKIAIDMHDGLGQLLSGVKLNLELAMNEKNIPTELAGILQNVKELSEESITESKNIASDLLPYNIKDFGLVAAIKNLCYKNNQLKISNVKFYSSDVPRKLPAEVEIAVYRITQELINNALKHAKASEIFVQLFFRENKLVLQVEDDGVGFSLSDKETKTGGMGLKNMEIRAQLLAGHLEIDSVANKGTTTLIEFPLTPVE